MTIVNLFSRYAHTIRHLQPVQIYGRIWRSIYAPGIDASPAPRERTVRQTWRVCVGRRPSLAARDQFTFLNEQHSLPATGNWDDVKASKLWRYNLHYFDDLNAADAQARLSEHATLLCRWVAENPPGKGTGWEPYPVSLRLVNWIKWQLQGNVMPAECLQSLAVQSRWLNGRIEHHLQGNHLLANAKALIFAGVFFDSPESRRWLARGEALLARQLPSQILADGGHVERSPMYQGILAEDVLDLVQLAELFPGIVDVEIVAMCRATASAMLAWLAVMSHPDGEISFFNDAAIGIAAPPMALADYGKVLGIVPRLPAEARQGSGGVWLADSGYVRLETGRMVALLDLAPLGPDHLTAHGHADTLCFELSVDGNRVIVNGGTSCYGTSAQRVAERATAAHNTVELDGQNSSEVWSGFRTARRARIVPPVEVSLEPPLVVSAMHDGYRRLAGRPLHRRTWRMSAGGLDITDSMTRIYRKAIARLHLHPSVRIVARGGDRHELRLPSGSRMTVRVSNADVAVIRSDWHPRFGESIPSQCFELCKTGVSSAPLLTSLHLEPARA